MLYTYFQFKKDFLNHLIGKIYFVESLQGCYTNNYTIEHYLFSFFSGVVKFVISANVLAPCFKQNIKQRLILMQTEIL